MSRMGIIFNFVIFDCMIDGYLSIVDVLKVFFLFDEMVKLGYYLSIFIYGSLLKGVCRGVFLEEGKRFFRLL